MTGATRFLPYGRQDINEADIAAVVAALKGDWLTGGPAVEAFEAAIAAAVSAPFAIVCSSGTAALHMAAMASELGPGHTAIVPAITFAATANAARFVGAEVVFCDVDPFSGLATPETIQEALIRAEPKAKVVFVVHLNGQTIDMDPIAKIAEAHGLTVVEDACHAIGAQSSKNVFVGQCAHSDMAAFSFHPVKTIAAGEGGAVTCKTAELANRLASLRSHGIVRDAAHFIEIDQAVSPSGITNPWYHEMQELGYNYRITDLQCALGKSQLERLCSFVSRRQHLVEVYDHALSRLKPFITPIRKVANGKPAWHLYVASVDFDEIGMTRAELMLALREFGIGTQVHYLPVYRHPYYRRRYGLITLPGAERYYSRCISLPLFTKMDDSDVSFVVDRLAHILSNRLGTRI
jgi:UDP-4-amino-4,6-dideoxy-N-acetyl-beta-L-altrosamine transaminase